MSTLSLGSHLVVGRGLYTHHGIYIGNQRVIHYSGMASGLDKGCVEVTSLKSFAQGKAVRIKQYRKIAFSGTQICQRAQSRLGEYRYSILFNNCEHFATWCVTGEHSSEQIQAAIQSTGSAAASHLISRKLVEKSTGPVVRSLIANSAREATRSLVSRSAIQGASRLIVGTGAGGLTTAGLGLVGVAGGATIVPIVAALTVAVSTTYVFNKVLDFFNDW